MDGNIPLGSEADEVWPDFGFHEDDEARADVIESTADIGGGVVGKVAVNGALRVLGVVLGDLCAAGRGGTGKPEIVVGVSGEQGVQQWANGKEFTNADGMYPQGIR